MLILYANPVSNYAAKARIVLRLKGLAFEERLPPDGYGSAAYRQIVPMGTIPALIDGDFVLSESDTIIEYLQEAYPEPSLLPKDPKSRAKIRFLTRFHDLYLEPPLRAMFGQINPATRNPDTVAEQTNRFAKRLAQIEHHIDSEGPYLAGPISLADCSYPATIALAQAMLPALGASYAPGPKMQVWEHQTSQHPILNHHKTAYLAEATAWTDRKLRGA